MYRLIVGADVMRMRAWRVDGIGALSGAERATDLAADRCTDQNSREHER